MDVDLDRLAKALVRMGTRSRFCVSGDLRDIIMMILWDFVERRRRSDPIYTVDEWRADRSGVSRNLATSADWDIAKAAYEAALRGDRRTEVTLRNGIRCVRSSDDDRRKAARAEEERLEAGHPQQKSPS